MKKLHKNGAAKYAEYGPLVREEIVVGEPIVWVFRPEDIAEVFKADVARYPERRSHRALFKYRVDRRWIYNTGGLLPTYALTPFCTLYILITIFLIIINRHCFIS